MSGPLAARLAATVTAPRSGPAPAATLSVRVGARLRDFELDAAWSVAGGMTVLFGYSGSGKSLTLSSIAGTFRPRTGRIRLGDETLFDAEKSLFVPPQKRRVGYVSQGAQLFPHLTVGRNVAFALRGAGRAEREARVTETLERLGIEALVARRPHELSGGQRQRAALARALVARPRLLLLDEPFSALDLPLRVEMRSVLEEVRREWDVPAVLVTHDPLEAFRLADTLVVYAGGVVQTGTPGELLGDPATPDIRRLLHAAEAASLTPYARGPRRSPHVQMVSRKENVA